MICNILKIEILGKIWQRNSLRHFLPIKENWFLIKNCGKIKKYDSLYQPALFEHNQNSV